MPTTPSHPGVFVEEVPSGLRSIAGVATSITAFIGSASRGSVDDAVLIRSFGEFHSRFGGLWEDATLGHAVQHFFAAGGRDALVVRVANGATAAAFELAADAGVLELVAASPGAWGNRLEAFVDHDVGDASGADSFNLTVHEVDVDGVARAIESFRAVSVAPEHPRNVAAVLAEESDLVRVRGAVPAERPAATAVNGAGEPVPVPVANAGADGAAIGFDQIAHPGLEAGQEGLWALERADLFNLLCIPPFDRGRDVTVETWEAAVGYCASRRAMLIVDPPASWEEPSDVLDPATGIDGSSAAVPARHANAAIYFPRVRMADPEQGNRLRVFTPCGVLAGIYARTDARRGVWKAPAGQDAALVGVRELTCAVNDADNGRLNPLGVNCLREFPAVGRVAWGARTMKGADRLGSEWKYVAVRRLALFLEESLDRGTRWVVFEPNDEPLWAQIRSNVGAFMHDLFRQGAFQGQSARDAYFVKCDRETTTQADIDRGIVNLLVGFAPLKPAEFVILKIRQVAARVEA